MRITTLRRSDGSNAWIPRRQKLLLLAAVLFFALRVWSYLYFIPQILDWNQGATGQPLSTAQLRQAGLWVDLSWVRLAMDAAIALLLLSAAFVPATDSRESRVAHDPVITAGSLSHRPE